jgi:hypothetical protein
MEAKKTIINEYFVNLSMILFKMDHALCKDFLLRQAYLYPRTVDAYKVISWAFNSLKTRVVTFKKPAFALSILILIFEFNSS